MNRKQDNRPGLFRSGVGLVLFLGGMLPLGCARPPQPGLLPQPTRSPVPPTIHLTAETPPAFEVAGIDPATLKLIHDSTGSNDPDSWTRLFPVYAGDGTDPMLGTYRITEEKTLRFEPRFPLVPGVRYRAVLRNLPRGPVSSSTFPEVTAEFTIPRPETPPTFVVQVYPTASVLPENHLRFYIHFSGPMSRGEAYQHIKLFDENGNPIDGAFLELTEELWDGTGTRFTLLIEPGRIKRGLKLREDLGPVLETGKRYTLVVNKGWHDAHGNVLRESWQRSFTAAPEQNNLVDYKAWKITPPKAGNTEPLEVTFPIPLDHALLHRELWVADAAGTRIPGKITVTDHEKRWQFTPDAPWKAGEYRLVARTTLEDTAGNSIGQLFEVDIFKQVDPIKSETVERAFQVKE